VRAMQPVRLLARRTDERHSVVSGTVPTVGRTPPPGVSPAPDWHTARAISWAAPASCMASETVDLPNGFGRVLAEPVTAACDVPHYASSAMDGWAIAGDGNGPWTLVASEELAPGEARAIVTGALIPVGTRAVLRSEYGDETGHLLTSTALEAPSAGQHVRPVGTEATAGDTVIAAGTVLNPAHLALAAGCGRDELAVVTRPRVALVFTGDEVVVSGIPTPGKVRDSFGPQLPHVVTLLGGAVSTIGRVRDNATELQRALTASREDSDLIITTGGTGRSTADHLRATLSGLGATVLVDSVAMRPGGPTMLWRLPDGRFVVALPGNPLAAMVGLLTVAAPLVTAMLGVPLPDPRSVVTAAATPGRAGTTLLAPYRLVDGTAVTTDWTGSGMMRGLADADGILVVPASGLAAGSSAESITLPWAPRR